MAFRERAEITAHVKRLIITLCRYHHRWKEGVVCQDLGEGLTVMDVAIKPVGQGD
jgi:hypothetical protein